MKQGEGAGGGTPSAQLGGLGEGCKFPPAGSGAEPQTPTLFKIISCSKHYIKLRAKTDD